MASSSGMVSALRSRRFTKFVYVPSIVLTAIGSRRTSASVGTRGTVGTTRTSTVDQVGAVSARRRASSVRSRKTVPCRQLGGRADDLADDGIDAAGGDGAVGVDEGADRLVALGHERSAVEQVAGVTERREIDRPQVVPAPSPARPPAGIGPARRDRRRTSVLDRRDADADHVGRGAGGCVAAGDTGSTDRRGRVRSPGRPPGRRARPCGRTPTRSRATGRRARPRWRRCVPSSA